MPEHKRVTLHPVKQDGQLDLDVNLYPKTLINGVVDAEGQEVPIATKADIYALGDDLEEIQGELNNFEDSMESALADKQERLVSGSNIKTINGQSILGNGNINIESNHPFDPAWPVDSEHTTKNFCDALDADPNVTIGMSYLGGASWSDLPFSGNGDVEVDIMRGPNNTKAIKIVLTSSNTAPYHWERTYWNHGSISDWIGFQPELKSGTNIKTINGQSVLGSGNIEVVTDLSDYSTTAEMEEYVGSAIQESSDSLSGAIEAESSRALEAEGILSSDIEKVAEKVTYFKKFVDGANVDAQFEANDKVYCYEGTMIEGGDVPSTISINLPQAANVAIYIHSLYLRYIDKDNNEQEYSYTFGLGANPEFTAYGQTQNLGGISWLLQQTNTGATVPSNAKPNKSNFICLKCGAGSAATATKNLSLSTEDLGGCTLLDVKVGACVASGGNAKLSVLAGNDTWFFNDGEAQTESTEYQIPVSATAAPYDGAQFEFTNEPDGTELGEATIITFTNTFLYKEEGAVLREAPKEGILYVNLELNKFYRFNGTTLIEVSGLEFGFTNTTAYRGDYGQQNYEALQELRLTKQETLESGVNIKTINNESLLGEGNLELGGSDIKNERTALKVDEVITETILEPVITIDDVIYYHGTAIHIDEIVDWAIEHASSSDILLYDILSGQKVNDPSEVNGSIIMGQVMDADNWMFMLFSDPSAEMASDNVYAVAAAGMGISLIESEGIEWLTSQAWDIISEPGESGKVILPTCSAYYSDISEDKLTFTSYYNITDEPTEETITYIDTLTDGENSLPLKDNRLPTATSSDSGKYMTVGANGEYLLGNIHTSTQLYLHDIELVLHNTEGEIFDYHFKFKFICNYAESINDVYKLINFFNNDEVILSNEEYVYNLFNTNCIYMRESTALILSEKKYNTSQFCTTAFDMFRIEPLEAPAEDKIYWDLYDADTIDITDGSVVHNKRLSIEMGNPSITDNITAL